MKFNLTNEQQQVVDHIRDIKGEELVLVDSVAGSGKTTLLKAIANEFLDGTGIYLAYNKALATEATGKFPSCIDCRTTHSLAYRAIVPALGLKIGFFGTRSIDDRISYTAKQDLVENIKEFCLSSHLSYDDFAKENERSDAALANKYLTLMTEGKIECSHDLYLKLFHIYLAEDKIDQVDYDLVLLDEAGDLNEVTLEVFKLLNGRVKVAVGDVHQNIFTFNHTINCFARLKDEGTMFRLTKSFRVPTHIAKPVENFCQKYLDPVMIFEGVEPSNDPIRTRGYISRTNAGLIGKIIELNQSRTPYGLIRKAQEIFKVPLIVAGLKYQGKIYDSAYKHLQADVDDWHENVDNVKKEFSSLYGFLQDKYEDDLGLMQSIRLVQNHSKATIFEAYAQAKKHERKKHTFMLMTAHSCKGLELDEVMFAPDMNKAIEPIIDMLTEHPDAGLTTQERESMNLYYVAATRATNRLINAIYL